MSRAIVLIGFMAAGKSVVGRHLADLLGRAFLDLDDLVAALGGRPVPDLIRERGLDHFRRLEARALRQAVALSNTVVATGGGAPTAAASQRLLAQAGVPVVWLTVSAEEAWRRADCSPGRRTAGSASRPLLPATPEATGRLLADRGPAYARVATLRVETTGRTPEEVASSVAESLQAESGENRAAAARGGPSQPVVLTGGPDSHGPVVVGQSLLGRLAELPSFPRPVAGPVFLVADPLPAALWGETVRVALGRAGLKVAGAVLPGGESSKCPRVLSRLWEAMAESGLGRTGLVISLGGGACSDVAGLAAGSFMRGLRVVHLPTTLLAQVDAAVGGKTAVNLSQGKNLVGLFHFPCLVVADTDACRTLPAELRSEGLVELYKTLLVDGAIPGEGDDLLNGIRSSLPAWPSSELIARAVRIKLELVGRDPLDQGPRQALNLGHTIGHALEAAAGFGRIRHGLAVAVGLLAAVRLSARQGRLPPKEAGDVAGLVSRLLAGFPARSLQAVASLDPDEVTKHLAWDKKRTREGLVLILLEAGADGRIRTVASTGTASAAVREALTWALACVDPRAGQARRDKIDSIDLDHPRP